MCIIIQFRVCGKAFVSFATVFNEILQQLVLCMKGRVSGPEGSQTLCTQPIMLECKFSEFEISGTKLALLNTQCPGPVFT